MSPLLLIALLLTQAPAPAPSPNKQVALGAIAAARAAIDQSKAQDKRGAANARLKEAEELFAKEQFNDAAKAADAAWRLVSDSKEGPTAFSVEVKDDGKTTVTSKKGQPVRVDAEGVSQPLYAGQLVTIDKGKKPNDVVTPVVVGIPESVAPKADEKLKMKATDKALVVSVSWKPASNAKNYEVELRPLEASAVKPVVMKVSKTTAKLPPLPPGKYVWAVRALGPEGSEANRSEERAFELVRDAVKIEVGKTGWK